MVKYLYSTDKYNYKNRTMNNCEGIFVNCGGFAFETMNWYCPYDSSMCIQTEDETEWHLDETTPWQDRLESTVNFMLADLPFIRKIKSPKELNADEYCVAYRMQKDSIDFHFYKLDSFGNWLCKWGYGEKIYSIPYNSIFIPWDETYDTPIVFFAVKKYDYRDISLVQDDEGYESTSDIDYDEVIRNYYIQKHFERVLESAE